MNTRIKRLLAGGATAVVLVGAVWATAVAQTVPPPSKPAAQQQADAFLNSLAAKLGKTPDEVREAAKAAQKELVAQALQAGRITQEQANRLNQRIDRSNGLPFRPGVVGPGLGAKALGVKRAPAARATFGGAELAQFLGMTPQALNAELRSGKSLAQVAQAQGKPVDQLKSFMRDQAKARLDAQVAAGRITQAQADAALQKLTDNLDQVVNRMHPARGAGKGKGQPTKAAFSL